MLQTNLGKMQKDIDILTVDCLWQIFLRLPLTDLLTVEKVCTKWNIAAQATWPTTQTLRIKDLPDNDHLKEVTKKADKYVRTLDFRECENAGYSLRRISGLFHNVERMEFWCGHANSISSLTDICTNLNEVWNLVDEKKTCLGRCGG